MTAPTFANKLEKRLAALTDIASPESIQTLARWIGFNRKHASSFATTIVSVIQNVNNATRKMLYMSVVHECLILDSPKLHASGNEEKWNRMSGLREIFGEFVVLNAVKAVTETGGVEKGERIREMLAEWEDMGALENSSVISEAITIVSNQVHNNLPMHEADQVERDECDDEGTTTSSVEEPVEQIVKEEISSSSDDVVPRVIASNSSLNNFLNADNSQDDKNIEDNSKITKTVLSNDVPFNFDSQDIKFEKVSSKAFLEPCKSIATLQITREIRTDVAGRIWEILQKIPPHIEVAALKSMKNGAASTDFSTIEGLADLPSDLLDIDIIDGLNEVKQFLDVVRKQKKARSLCMDLLIKSRCKFGSEDAAAEFHLLESKLEQLRRKKAMLSDAMELEGCDVEKEVDDEHESKMEQLEPLKWFEPTVILLESLHDKKQRTM